MGRELFYRLFQKTGSKVAKGEMWIGEAVVRGEGYEPKQESLIALSLECGADICFFSFTNPMQGLPLCSAEMESLIEAAHRSGQACGVTVDGPFERLVKECGFMAVMEWIHEQGSGRLQEGLRKATLQAASELTAANRAGADLLIVCDDIAYGNGLYFSPLRLADDFLPHYRQLRNSVPDAVLGFHSDGKMGSVLPALIQEGYSVFSLEPEAMDLVALRQELAEEVVLMSGIKAEWLLGDIWGDAELADAKEYITSLSRGGALILSSCCGLPETRCLERLTQIYGCLS